MGITYYSYSRTHYNMTRDYNGTLQEHLGSEKLVRQEQIGENFIQRAIYCLLFSRGLSAMYVLFLVNGLPNKDYRE